MNTIPLPGPWQAVQPTPMMRCANAGKINLAKIAEMSTNELNQLLTEVGKDISTQINEAIVEANQKGIKITNIDTRWVNILSSVFNPDGVEGSFRIALTGELEHKE